jgi:hypothetical protein
MLQHKPGYAQLPLEAHYGNPHTIYAGLLAKAGIYNVLYGEGTNAQKQRANRLWRRALDLAYGIIAIDVKGNTRWITPQNVELHPERDLLMAHEERIPAICGIIWHNQDDPTQNELTFDLRRKTHYEFNPVVDRVLLEDYKQDIVRLLFDV